jgi:FkbM family methyltransferase
LNALTIKEIFCNNEYDLKKNQYKTIIDIGANIGTFTLLASQTNPRARIYSFEPVPETYKILNSNVVLISCNNVTLQKWAIAPRESTRTFYSHKANVLASFTRTRGGMYKLKVKTVSIKYIFKKYKINTCDFLKIDAEGAEFEIIDSLDKYLARRIKQIVIEYHDRLTMHNHLELVKQLEKLGYTIKQTPHPIEPGIGILHAIRK